MCVGFLRFSRFSGLNLQSAIWNHNSMVKVKPLFEIEIPITQDNSKNLQHWYCLIVFFTALWSLQSLCPAVCYLFAKIFGSMFYECLTVWRCVALECGAGLPTRMPYLPAYFCQHIFAYFKISFFQNCGYKPGVSGFVHSILGEKCSVRMSVGLTS